MSVTMEWKGESVGRQIRARAAMGLTEAGRLFKARVEENTPVRSGEMRAGWRITVDAQRMRVVVYNPVKHSVFVEFGTSRMAPRAPARRALDEFAPVFKAVLTEAMKGG